MKQIKCNDFCCPVVVAIIDHFSMQARSKEFSENEQQFKKVEM